MRKIRVVADTPLGVTTRDFDTGGRGVLLIERFQEKFAEAERCRTEEIEILTITDVADDRVLFEAEAKPVPTPDEIRAAQEASAADVERQLAEGLSLIRVGERDVQPESAWACVTAIRKAWELGGRYAGQELLEDGTWMAHVEVPIGRFEG